MGDTPQGLPLAAADITAAWRTDGSSLAKTAFSSKVSSMTSPAEAKQLYFDICNAIMTSDLVSWSGLRVCEECTIFETQGM